MRDMLVGTSLGTANERVRGELPLGDTGCLWLSLTGRLLSLVMTSYGVEAHRKAQPSKADIRHTAVLP